MVSNRGAPLITNNKASWGGQRSIISPIFVSQIENINKIGRNTPAPGYSHNHLEWKHDAKRFMIRNKSGPKYDRMRNFQNKSEVRKSPRVGSYVT